MLKSKMVKWKCNSFVFSGGDLHVLKDSRNTEDQVFSFSKAFKLCCSVLAVSKIVLLI